LDHAAPLRDRILDAALELAGTGGWHDLSLNAVADRLGVGLAEIQAVYRDRDALADAWFGRALTAMLAPPAAGFGDLPASARIEMIILRWFEAQAQHASLAIEMLRVKAWPSHPHHWVPMVFDLSRLVHWWLDAAQVEASGFRRMAQEVGLTALLLRALAAWQADARAGAAAALPRTRRVVRRGVGWMGGSS
jgi:AcrR family transcriptional regulator